MDKSSGQSPVGLFPSISPYDQRMLDVGDGHLIYVEQCGNPSGEPVLVLHGGPGGGCSPMMRRYFDPQRYRIILFDQRGCGRSRPHASVEANTTWHLVRDIEVIRKSLGVEHWALFGGSWGATLALIYAQDHASRVTRLTLRGPFLMTQDELDWFYGGGVGRFWPENWQRFSEVIPESERHDMIAAYHRRLFGGDPSVEVQFARIWTAWENGLAAMASNGHAHEPPADYARAFARLECHYFVNKGWLPKDGHILANMDRLAGIPGVIVQGRYDMICPPNGAAKLHAAWSGSELIMVAMAGHALSEPAITSTLLAKVNAHERADG
ncbi:MAG: prolyl aminopeptidase [Deltaproteobacteria bacterium]